MKKLICYFVLISSFLCGVGGASSNRGGSNINNEDREWAARVGPRQAIITMFQNGLKDRNFKEKERIIATPSTILEMYPNRPDLQKQAIDVWGQCMRNQIVNGQKKYTDQDVNILVNFSKRKLGLN